MDHIEDYLDENRWQIGDRLRLLVGTANRPAPTGKSLLVALTRPLAESGLMPQTAVGTNRPLIATGGQTSGCRVVLLFQLDAPLPAAEPGGSRAGLVAALAALAALRATEQPVPVQVVLACDPDRSTGSVSLTRQSFSPATICLWDGGSYRGEQPWVALGSHGLLRVRLRAEGPGGPLGLGGLLVNPAWRLIWALALLKHESEELQPAELYAALRSPTEAELAALDLQAPALAELVARTGGRPLLGLTGVQLPLVQSFSPTMSVTDLKVEAPQGGYLPTTASAELTMTLVPEQTPAATLAALRRHLAARELADVTIEQIAAYEGWETPSAAPLVGVVERLIAEHGGQTPLFIPFAEQPAPLLPATAGSLTAAVGLGTGHAPWPVLEERVLAQARLLAALLQRLASVMPETQHG